MSIHELEKPSSLTRKEVPPTKRAVVLVPGLGESGTEVFSDIAKEMRHAPGYEKARFFTATTHQEYDSKRQHSISKKLEKTENDRISSVPIMGIVANAEKNHHSFEDRVRLATEALEEAKRTGAREIVFVGHSAGGAATLAALTREIKARQLLSAQRRTEAPSIHAILVAPAVPGNARKAVVFELSFLTVMVHNFLESTVKLQQPYVWNFFTGKEFVPNNNDMRTILGPTNDQEYEERILQGIVPISGEEAVDLLSYPDVFSGLKRKDWPRNVQVDVVIPNEDRWVNRKGQDKLAEALKKLAGENARVTWVPGGHIPLGSREPAVGKIVNRATRTAAFGLTR